MTGQATSAVFILDGLAELGRDGLTTAGQDLADKLTALHPDARLSWRQIGAAPEYPKCATANGARTA